MFLSLTYIPFHSTELERIHMTCATLFMAIKLCYMTQLKTRIEYPNLVIFVLILLFQDSISQEPSSISIFRLIMTSHLKLLYRNEGNCKVTISKYIYSNNYILQHLKTHNFKVQIYKLHKVT